MNRRRFLHGSAVAVTGCLCASAIGCHTANPNAKVVNAAAASGGRVSLGKAAELAVGGQLKVQVAGVESPLLVARVSTTEVKAIAIACSHFGSDLEYGNGEWICTNHGSRFDYQGKVLEGPASDAMPTYDVVEEGGELFLIAGS